MKLENFLTQYTKVKSKLMKELNVRQETIKILVKNTDSNLFDICCSNFLLDMSPEGKETKAKIDCWEIKIKTSCTVKNNEQN